MATTRGSRTRREPSVKGELAPLINKLFSQAAFRRRKVLLITLYLVRYGVRTLKIILILIPLFYHTPILKVAAACSSIQFAIFRSVKTTCCPRKTDHFRSFIILIRSLPLPSIPTRSSRRCFLTRPERSRTLCQPSSIHPLRTRPISLLCSLVICITLVTQLHPLITPILRSLSRLATDARKPLFRLLGPPLYGATVHCWDWEGGQTTRV